MKYLNAICVCNLPQGGNQFLKYHGIDINKLEKFKRFAAKIPDLHHVNLYWKGTKQFYCQLKLQDITGQIPSAGQGAKIFQE